MNPDATKFIAEMIGTFQLDENLVQRVIERIRLVDDGYDVIDTLTENESVDEHGNKRKGVTRGKTYRPRPKREEIETQEDPVKL